MTIFGVQAPDSGNMELLAHGATDAQKERWLWPNLRGEISQRVRADRAVPRRRRPHRASAPRAVRDGDEWVINGHKWFITNASVADIVLVFAETNPESRPAQARVDLRGPGGHAGHGDRARHPDDGASRRRVRAAGQPRRDRVPATAGCPPTTSSATRATASCWRRSGSAAGASTTPCAGSARPSGRFDIMCERAVSRESHGKLLGPAPDDPGLHRAVAHRDPGGAAAHVPDGVEDGQVRRGGGPRRHLDGEGARLAGRCSTVLDRTIQVCGALGYSGDLPVEGGTAGTRFGTDRRRSRRGAQDGASPAPSSRATAGRGLADRAHPEPTPGRRGEVGRAARRGRCSRDGGSSRLDDRTTLDDASLAFLDEPTRRPAAPTRRADGRAAGRARCSRCDRGSATVGAAAGARATPARPPRTTCCASSASSTAIKDERVAIARPVVACGDPAVFGAPFYVMERIDGVPGARRHPRSVGAGAGDARPRRSSNSSTRIVDVHAVDWRAVRAGRPGRAERYPRAAGRTVAGAARARTAGASLPAAERRRRAGSTPTAPPTSRRRCSTATTSSTTCCSRPTRRRACSPSSTGRWPRSATRSSTSRGR